MQKKSLFVLFLFLTMLQQSTVRLNTGESSVAIGGCCRALDNDAENNDVCLTFRAWCRDGIVRPNNHCTHAIDCQLTWNGPNDRLRQYQSVFQRHLLTNG